MKVFIVTADYRNPPTNTYAVHANSKKEAKDRVKSITPWLKIYNVEEYTGDPNDIDVFLGENC